MATKMLQGLITLGTLLKITQILPAEFKAELDAFVAADGDFNAARTAKQAASDVFKPADSTLTTWLQTTRNILAGRFGNRWSTMWAQAGFTNNTTAVPNRIADRLSLALKLANFFTANPSYEVASMNVTAAQATTLRYAAVSADEALTAADVALKNKGDAWNTVCNTLTDTMRSLINILRATLNNDDPRWLTFGLDMPSTDTTPGQPLNVTVHLDDEANLVLACDAPVYAARFRWRGLLVGIETEPRLIGRSVDPIATVPSPLPGQTLQIIVQAVNFAGSQDVASEPILFTMPPVDKTLATVAHVAGDTPASTPANNNGHAKGSRRLASA